MPPTELPRAQPVHTTSLGSSTVLSVSEFGRQVPGFFMSHHAGSGSSCEMRWMTTSFPLTCASGLSNLNDPTSTSLPAFVSQANDWFCVLPASHSKRAHDR